ncbi:MAG: S8 family serine peptidase [Syntrophobacter sp.]
MPTRKSPSGKQNVAQSLFGGLPTGPTGRHIVVMRPEGSKALVQSLQNTAGLKVAHSADFENAVVRDSDLAGNNALILEHLGLAVVDADPSQCQSLQMAIADESNPVLSIEPELFVIPYSEFEGEPGEGRLEEALLTPAGREYLRGYSDAIQGLSNRLLGTAELEGAMEAAATFADSTTLTWGLQATRADKSRLSGSGIRVAVLDTGLDFKHPDFTGRSIISASFVPGVATAQDGHGHGTHCIGTSCGPKSPPPSGTSRRYGIAHLATILVGKVLDDQGSGQTGWILAGINWAIQNKAVVISMSLGSPVKVGDKYSFYYEQTALTALNNNCVIIAAAGNSGQHPQYYPVASPANCPSVMGVGALDVNLKHAPFSCIGVNPLGGEVNIAAPGVGVFSSTKMPTRYAVMSGTSMATPHVAGCAALLAQWTGLRGRSLWRRVESMARAIGIPVEQAGAGLAQAASGALVVRPVPFPKPIARPVPLPISSDSSSDFPAPATPEPIEA